MRIGFRLLVRSDRIYAVDHLFVVTAFMRLIAAQDPINRVTTNVDRGTRPDKSGDYER